MTTEFIKKSKDNVIVINDKGSSEERIIEVTDVERQLMLENNLEYIDNIINKLKDYIYSSQEFNLSDIISEYDIPIIVTMSGLAMGALFKEEKLLISGLGIGAAWWGLSILYAGINRASRLKNIKNRKAAYEVVLEKAYVIKEDILNELESLKGSAELDKNDINKIIPVLEDDSFINNTKDSLNEEYKNNVFTRKLQQELPF